MAARRRACPRWSTVGARGRQRPGGTLSRATAALDGLAYGLIVVCGAIADGAPPSPGALWWRLIAIGLAVWLGRGVRGRAGVRDACGWPCSPSGSTAPRRVVFVTAASAALGLFGRRRRGLRHESEALALHALLVGWSATAALLGVVVRSRREQCGRPWRSAPGISSRTQRRKRLGAAWPRSG